MTRNTKMPTRIFVVDASPTDYDTAQPAHCNSETELTFFGSGREALRTNPDDSPNMWVINVRLPDMAGTTLHDMLRSRGCKVAVALIGDTYQVEDERAARISGVNVYLAKPLSSEFLETTCCG
jgi:DNA-binding response OmpR family regulator